MKTLKVGAAGKYGSRYGRSPRRDAAKVMEKKKASYPCPYCGKVAVRRLSSGVWRCGSCKTGFSGGAYQPQTEAGRLAVRAVHGEKVTEEAK